MNIDLLVLTISNGSPKNKWMKSSINNNDIFNVLDSIKPVVPDDSWINNIYERIGLITKS